MEIINWTLGVLLVGFAILNILKIRQLDRQLVLSVASFNDLTFKFNEMVDPNSIKSPQTQISPPGQTKVLSIGQEVSMDFLLSFCFL